MARLYRPHIPLSVRVQVAERQLDKTADFWMLYCITDFQNTGARLKFLLFGLSQQLDCEVSDLRLDHDPALCNRDQRVYWRGDDVQGMNRIVLYSPPSNDPEHLLYRTKADHDIKTRVRGDGAQHSDLALRRIAKRRARKAEGGKLSTRRLAKPGKRRDKKPWPKRPMPKGRGFPKRRG